jgi:hypothetical protein
MENAMANADAERNMTVFVRRDPWPKSRDGLLYNRV